MATAKTNAHPNANTNGRRRQMCLTSEIIRYSTICLFGVCTISRFFDSTAALLVVSLEFDLLFLLLLLICFFFFTLLISLSFLSLFQLVLFSLWCACSPLLYIPKKWLFLSILIIQTSFHCIIAQNHICINAMSFAQHVRDNS